MWEIEIVRIYACGNEQYKEELQRYLKDNWEPFSSEYEGDNWHTVRLKRQKTEYDC